MEGFPDILPGRLRSLVISFAVALALTLGFGSGLPEDANAARCSVSNGLGSYGHPNPVPGACWRPYSDSSPFNRALPKKAKVVRGSKAIVKQLVGRGDGVDDFVAGDEQFDVGTSIFFSEPTDPEVTVRCTYSDDWTPCDIEGMVVRVPAAATPAGGFSTPDNDHDAHMTIVDQSSGWEYDFWNVQSMGDGEIVIGYGGRTQVTGAGLGSDGVAARYGNLAGVIRYKELAAGQINHALSLFVPCTTGFVYPAAKSDFPCDQLGVTKGPAMGSHFQLDMTKKEINRLKVPRWKKTIVRALARYGAYVSDTTGSTDWWGFKFESPKTYTAFGDADPWVSLAQGAGIGANDFNGNGQAEHRFNMASKIPWKKLRIVK